MIPDVGGHEVNEIKHRGQNYLLPAVRFTVSPTTVEQCQFTLAENWGWQVGTDVNS